MGAMKIDTQDTTFPTDNTVAPFALEGAPVRGRLARLGSAIDEVLTRHDYPEAVANLLGEACTLAALVGSNLKFEGRLIKLTLIFPLFLCVIMIVALIPDLVANKPLNDPNTPISTANPQIDPKP